MFDAFDIAIKVPLPAAPEHWFNHSYGVTIDGRLILVCAPAGPGGRVGSLRLSIFDGVVETDVTIIPSSACPIVDRTSDGQWIVASIRAGAGERNARLYSASGREEHAMILGDGISSLLCSPDGTLWVGYFDEGVFGTPNEDGSPAVSSGGLVKFDISGNVLWSFNDQAEVEYGVDDAYAMTIIGNTLWACFYSDFPITRVDEGKITFWSNAIAGASAIAVQDDIVLLAGGYGDKANHIHLLKLDGSGSRQLGCFRFQPAAAGKVSLMQGRGNTLHVMDNGIWYRIPVEHAVQSLGRR